MNWYRLASKSFNEEDKPITVMSKSIVFRTKKKSRLPALASDPSPPLPVPSI
jgi:hypothetical protein